MMNTVEKYIALCGYDPKQHIAHFERSIANQAPMSERKRTRRLLAGLPRAIGTGVKHFCKPAMRRNNKALVQPATKKRRIVQTRIKSAASIRRAHGLPA